MASQRPPDRADALGTAQTLVNSLDRMEKRLAEVNRDSEQRDERLARYGRRNRLFIAVDVLLTVVSSVAVAFAVHASRTADQTQQAAATTCAVGNGTRATLTQVFDHVFATFKAPSSDTPAQRAEAARRIAGIEAYYRGKFAPRNCTAIYGVTPGKPAASPGRSR